MSQTKKDFSFKWSLSDLNEVKPNGKTVFSCFSGAGGSSMGYKMAGYEVIGCNEIDQKQMDLYKLNFNPKYSYCEDIRDFIARDDLPDELYKLDILDTSPPCSLFSAANLKADEKKGKKVKFREGQVSQVLDDLVFEVVKLTEKLKPKVTILENVSALVKHKKNDWYVKEIYKRFDEVGYKVTHKLINLSDLGVPQKRVRVFFFAVRNDIEVKTSDIFGVEPILELPTEKHITIGEIESDYKGRKPTVFINEKMKNYREGDTSLGEIRERVDGKTTGFQTFIVKDSDVCNTLRPRNDFVRVEHGNINFSDFELIQLGTFPSDYNFNNKGAIYPIGMSVPPLGMYKISKAIDEQWGER